MHRQANFAGAHYLEAGASSLGPDGDVNVFYLPTISDEFGTVVLGAGTHAVAFTDKPETLAVLEYIGTAEYANARIASDKAASFRPTATMTRRCTAPPSTGTRRDPGQREPVPLRRLGPDAG